MRAAPRRPPGVPSVSDPERGVAEETDANGGVEIRRRPVMGYGIGGVLILILVILAIIYFAKRV
jgi:hypothetical protein